MRIDWGTPTPTPLPRLSPEEAAAIEAGTTTWEDVARQHEGRAILRRLRPPLPEPEPEPEVTEFGRSAAVDAADMELVALALIAVSCAFTVGVIYLIGRYLP